MLVSTSRDFPETAAWRHLDSRVGFEVVFLRRETDGYQLDGHATAVEDGKSWGIRYALSVDASWGTRSAHIFGRSAQGASEVGLVGDGTGRWWIDGKRALHLDGCLDVDLEASAFTNALPVHRLLLNVGQQADAPAAYVRALDLHVDRLEQSYLRLPDEGEHLHYEYVSPAFDFRAELVYDKFGLVLDYPGIAVRVDSD